MNDREKLIELIGLTEYGNGALVGKNFQRGFIGKIADNLIANGVTVQQWIPVSDRLPDKNVVVLVHYIHSYCDTDGYWSICTTFFDGDQFGIWVGYKVTHWMQIPQPPKGEQE